MKRARLHIPQVSAPPQPAQVAGVPVGQDTRLVRRLGIERARRVPEGPQHLHLVGVVPRARGENPARLQDARSAEIQARVRAEFRKDGSNQARATNPSRYFFAPLDLLLRMAEKHKVRPMILVMPAGDRVTVTGAAENDFLPVRYHGQEGWASAEYLE